MEWIITITVAVLGVSSTVTAALIAKRPAKLDPFAQMQAITERMQQERTADRADNAELSKRVDHLYTQLGASRDQLIAYEDWCAAGHPDPPGRPPRSGIITTH